MKLLRKRAKNPEAKAKKKRTAPKWLRAIGRPLKPVARLFRFLRFLAPVGRYFVGAWRELRQVVWPTRSATLKLTIAVILFTAIMTAFITLLDLGFEQLVKRTLL